MTDLSIIIVSYNTAGLTKKCIESIIASLKGSKIYTEIILFDNASTDNTIDTIQKLKIKNQNDMLKFKIIYSVKNAGFAKGNNKAVKQASGKNLLFLNTDIEVLNDAIPNLFNYFIEQNQFQFIGAKLFNKDLTPQPSTGPFYTLPYVFAWLFLRGDSWGASRSSPDNISAVDWVSGACFITKKDCFKKLVGFDEKIFMYMDEVDLFYRAKKQGYRIGFYPKAKFIHLGSASSQGKTQPILQVYTGLLYFYSKHYSKFQLKILKLLLQLKAIIAYSIGLALNNNYLKTTYAKAYKMVQDYR